MNQYHIRTNAGPISITCDHSGTILTMDRRRWRRAWLGRSITDFRVHLIRTAISKVRT